MNLLTINSGIKDNFEQGGIVPLSALIVYASLAQLRTGIKVTIPPWH